MTTYQELDQINERVAKLLGWDEEQESPYGTKIFVNDKLKRAGRLDDYSRSIEAAWEVMRKLQAEWQVELCSGDRHGMQWSIRVVVDLGNVIYEEADTAPLAICLAFLKLNERPS